MKLEIFQEIQARGTNVKPHSNYSHHVSIVLIYQISLSRYLDNEQKLSYDGIQNEEKGNTICPPPAVQGGGINTKSEAYLDTPPIFRLVRLLYKINIKSHSLKINIKSQSHKIIFYLQNVIGESQAENPSKSTDL